MADSSDKKANDRTAKLEAMRKKQNREEKRSKFFFIGAIALVAALFIGGIAFAIVTRPDKVNATVTKGEQLVPNNVTTDGSFNITSQGAVNTNWTFPGESKKPRLEIFFDPQCPACGMFDRALSGTINDNNSAGKFNLYMNPVAFLNNSSTDEYSRRATNAVVTVAEKSPQYFMKFVTELYKIGNQPAEGIAYKSVSNEQLAKFAENVGVPADVANTFNKLHYYDWIVTHSEKQTKRTDLFPDGFSTPGVFIGGTMDKNGRVTGAKRIDFKSTDSYVQDFESAINAAQPAN